MESRTTLRGLRPVQAKLILTLVEEKRSTFTRHEAAKIVGTEAKALRNQLTDLVRRGWLERLGNGRYMVVPPEYGGEQTGESNVLALASASVPDGYVGWWNAASLHGFTTQVPALINVATPAHHRPRVLAGSEVHYHTLPARKYFGAMSKEVYGRPVRVPTCEKTLIDCLDRPRLCGGVSEICRIVWGAAGQIDWEKMTADLLRFGSTAVVQRFGFISDLVGVEIPEEARAKIKSLIKPGTRATLGGPAEAKKAGDPIGYVAEWGITVNFEASALLSDVPKISKHPR